MTVSQVTTRQMTGALVAATLLLIPVTHAAPVDIDADKITRAADGVITASGHVVIKRQTDTVSADQITYRTKQHIMEASGHVVISSASAIIHADTAQMQTQSQTGTIQHANIILPGGERLQADQVKRIDDQRFEADHVTYTSCPADAESWRIAANHALLDQEAGTLTTNGSRFELWQIPVLYLPWWQQPLRRKSGLLMPSFGSSKRRGTELGLPVYLAPYKNWDATLTPHWMSARGFMYEAEVRHISNIGYERLAAAGINDRLTGRLRGRLQADIYWKLPANAQLSINADHLSDHDYLADYATGDDINTRYLQSDINLTQQLNLAGTVTDWSLQAQQQQDLLLATNAATLQLLPRLQSSSRWQPNSNLIAHFDQQTTRYNRRTGVDGWRMDLHPYIELPWAGNGLSANLNGGIRHTRYWLQQTALSDKQPQRTTAEASLELRSDFERISEQHDWRHVISPVVRYDYVNAKDQSLLPNFDSSVSRLNWSNLLSGNRYAGLDRIEKVSRFSLLLENRIQHKEGKSTRDLLIIRAGASYDLSRSSVDSALQAAASHPLSNLLGEITWQPMRGITLYGNGQFNAIAHYWATAQAHINLSNSFGSLYAGYQHTDARYAARSSLIDINSTITVASRWQATAKWQYDRIRKLSQQLALGMKYQHPCWTAGAELYRSNRSSGTTNSADLGFRILIEIKGLGSVGS